MTARVNVRDRAGSRAKARRHPTRMLARLVVISSLAGAPAAVAVLGMTGYSGVAQAQTTSTSPPTTRASSSSTVPPPPPPPPAANASLYPCGAPRAGSPCSQDPLQLQVNLPSNTDVTAVQLSWVAESGRTSGVPSNNPPTFLQVANQVGCDAANPAGPGQTPTCWTWPSSMEYPAGGRSWVINGTYQVTPCSAVGSGGCNLSSSLGPTQVQIAAPPAPPAGLAASGQGTGVVLKWQAGAEPDLVGYVVSRNSQSIYTCSTNGFGPGAGRGCPNPPSFFDNPGFGTWNYQVEAIRFGVDTSAAHVVRSQPAGVTASLSPGSPSGGAGGSGGGGGGSQSVQFNFSLPPIPPTGVMSPVYGPVGLPGRAPATAAIGEGEPGVTQANPNLPYSDNPALGATTAEATGTSERPPVKLASHSVNAAAELALAIIALSLAVHAWYVRDELRKAAARVAARKAIDPTGLPST